MNLESVKNVIDFYPLFLILLQVKEAMVHYILKKYAASVLAECCHKKNPLQCDHAHGTTEFRGWICKSCNVGLGELGDNLQAVLQAAIYLESDTNKIIKTLHEVYNEMFARTFKFNDE